MPNVFTQELVVPASAIDELQHVNNVQYLHWVQDMAKAHWEHLATPQMLADYFWVVVNHFIEYKGEAREGDQLLMKTYVEASKGVTSVRIVEIYKENQLITRAKTTWCLLDVKTKRPTRITTAIVRVFE